MSRRQGFYISKDKRGGLDFDLDESDEEPQEQKQREELEKIQERERDRLTTEYFLKELDKKEKEASAKALEFEQLQKYQKNLQKALQRENVQFKFIEKPEQSRLSIAPLSERKQYDFEQRSLEKTALGSYFFLKYLENNKKLKNACFIMPNFDLSLDAIKLFYEFPKQGIVLPKESLRNWKLAEPSFKNTSLYQMYKNTLDLIVDNFDAFHELLMFSDRGPRLTKMSKFEDKITKRKVSIFDRNIYLLLSSILNSQIMKIDFRKGQPVFMFPLKNQVDKCIQENKRFIILYLHLFLGNNKGHANMIVIDTKEKTIERYEPNGLDIRFYNSKQVDKILERAFKGQFEYFGPEDFCTEGIQDIFESETIDIYKFEGFCQTWSFIYAYFKILYGEQKDKETLVDDLKDLVIKMAKKYYSLLYNLEQDDIDFEDYDFVIEFLYEYIPEIVKKGSLEIQKINTELGTDLVLEGRTLHTKN